MVIDLHCPKFVEFRCTYEQLFELHGDKDFTEAAILYSIDKLRAHGIHGELLPIGGHLGIDHITTYFKVEYS